MPKTALKVDENAIIKQYETMKPEFISAELREHGIDAQTVQATVARVKKRVAEWERSRKK